MPVLQVNDRSVPIRPGQTRLGVGEGVDVEVTTAGSERGVHAILEMSSGSRVVVRRGTSGVPVKVNGIALGVEPTPLIHGDKLEIGHQELLFSDDTKAGATQFVSASDFPGLVQKRTGPARATKATGGRLVSLVDGKEYSIPDKGIVIGRDAGSDVVVAQNEVSRRHAEIVPGEQGYVVRDLSTNGVLVNGERVQHTLVLSRADVLRIGTEEFRFYADVAPAAPKQIVPEKIIEAAVSAVVSSPQFASPGGSGVPAAAPPPDTSGGAVSPSAPAPVRKDTEPVTAPGVARGADVRPVLASLEVVNEGIDKGKRYEVRDPLAHIGRGDHNDVVIPSDSVSDTHAKLIARQDGWYIADLGSTNGTYVGGVRLTGEQRLEGTPDVRFGGVKVIFRAVTPPKDVAKGTRAIASVAVDRASRPAAPANAAPAAAERSTSPWLWLLIVAAAIVAALLLLNR